MEPPSINPCTILIRSPFAIYGHQDEAEPFHSMLKNAIAPHYRIRSLTTVLMCIPIIIYITLVVRYPPFLRIPSFALEPLQLTPENLRHFEFYRLFTSPFVFEQMRLLIIICIVIWSFGSFTEEFLGRRMFIVFSGFYGLIGYAFYLSLLCFLVGCNFSYALMVWPSPNNNILYRKITLVIYLILAIIYFLIFINFPVEQKYSAYTATIYGIAMTFMFGIQKDGSNVPTFRKILQLVCAIVFIAITSLLLLNIVLYRATLI